ncbi:MAG: AAA family ATPase [Deltaproteobacteria bacterium]|nr:MAG: AAA family ATPase [Deltaproteobacteria bacterium]
MTDWEDFATHSVRRTYATEDVEELHIISGAAVGKTIDLLDEPVVIGSREPATLVIPDEHVSGLHCRFERTAQGVRISDLGSRNGTWLGGHRIIDAILAPGGRIKVGSTEIELIIANKSRLRSKWDGDDHLGEMYGKSPAMQQAFTQIAKLFAVDAHIMVRGESGTGKELVARALHQMGARSEGPFVVVDGACLSQNLADVELFGNVRGAFTGAVNDRAGAFERAHRGTLFLDELGEIPPSVQVKLLRALDEGMVQRVGEEDWRRVDVRVIAATHQNLEKMVNDGSFRLDLYHRIATFQVALPPLRERDDDVRFIAQRMLEQFAPGDGPARATLDEALSRLAKHAWPGNVRELRNVVRRVAALGEALPQQMPNTTGGGPTVRVDEPFHEAKESWIGAFERQYIAKLLDETGNNVSEAARRSGLSRMHLTRLIEKHGLRRER